MNENIAHEILHELFSAMEALDTQTTAILQFLREKDIANEEEMARHFEQAGNASSVRWRAVQVRIDYLLSSAMKAAQQDAEKESSKVRNNIQEPLRNNPKETSRSKELNKEEKEDAQGQQRSPSGQTEPEEVGASPGKEQTHSGRDKEPGRDKKGGETSKDKDNARDEPDQTKKSDRENAA